MRRVSMLLAVLLMGACGTDAPSPATTTAGAGSRHGSADVAFVQALIPHHERGIELASAVARQPAARTLAEAIIVTQRDEVARMSGWLREWSAAEPPSAVPPAAASPSAASLPAASLPAASSPAEPLPAASSPAARDPIRALIAHQQEAIGLAQREQAGGTNPAALAFAEQIVESRTEEIAQLRTYLG